MADSTQFFHQISPETFEHANNLVGADGFDTESSKKSLQTKIRLSQLLVMTGKFSPRLCKDMITSAGVRPYVGLIIFMLNGYLFKYENRLIASRLNSGVSPQGSQTNLDDFNKNTTTLVTSLRQRVLSQASEIRFMNQRLKTIMLAFHLQLASVSGSILEIGIDKNEISQLRNPLNCGLQVGKSSKKIGSKIAQQLKDDMAQDSTSIFGDTVNKIYSIITAPFILIDKTKIMATPIRRVMLMSSIAAFHATALFLAKQNIKNEEELFKPFQKEASETIAALLSGTNTVQSTEELGLSLPDDDGSFDPTKSKKWPAPGYCYVLKEGEYY